MNSPHPPKNDRVLVIDDNQAIRADFKKILQPADQRTTGLDTAGAELFGESPDQFRSAGFALDAAPSGEEGLALVQAARAKGQPYALAFVDVRMAPGWDGIETTARIFQCDPDIQIIICTAYSDYSWEEIITKLGQSDRLVILKKPFDPIEVLQLAHSLSGKWELGQKVRSRLDELEVIVATRTSELQAANDQLKTELAERARTEEFLRQSQKMDAVGRLAGGIAHDFNNLLTVIRGFVQCLTSEMHPNATVTEALHEIDAAAERAAKLTAQMLMFSHKKQLQLQSVNLNEIVAQFGGMLMRSLGEGITQIAAEYNQAMQSGMLLRSLGEDIILEIQTGNTPLPVRADPVMIELVVLNLALNARDAMPHGGRLVIITSMLDIKEEDCRRNARARPGKFACINVEDTGCGITPDALPHLFEPFFTTKEAGQGAGLGLASAYGIVKQHEGWIEVESEPDHGSRFKVFLPFEVKKAVSATTLRLVRPTTGGKETILIVEDEPPLRHLAKMWLERQGYRIYEAATGVEALAVWESHAAEIDLLLTDMMMPGGVSGRELAERLLQKKSDLKVIYTTGYSPDAFSQQLELQEGVNFLGKPYHPSKLTETVRRRLDDQY
jgi:signal transduction histidine kinase